MTDPVFANVTVFGSGTMGSGIAQICSQAGSKVALFDIGQDLLDTGMGRLGAFLEKGVAKGKMAQDEADAVLARVTPTVDFDAAVAEADLVIEAIPERLDLKQKMFRDTAEKVSAKTVLATNTSSLSLARIFDGIPQPARCIGTHFFNPPPIMPLLEIVRATGTDDSTVDRVLEYAKQLRKEPIVVKDSPGFATSRLGVVLGLEAIRMVEAGVASPEDIDKAMELGYRHPMGPLRLTDLVGLDVRMAIADYLREELDSPAFRVPTLMREMVERGETGKKSGKGFYDWG
jgi:3-hydroxybutyryl-CoA dehydrogenase